MKLGDAFPSKWLAASDIPDEGLVVTIHSYEMQDVGQGDRKENKPVLFFKEKDVKALVLNKTNAKVIEKILGSDDLDDWIGHKITLVPREVEFQGETVWAIRVQLPRPVRGAAKAAGRANTPSGPQFDDRVPPDDEIGL